MAQQFKFDYKFLAFCSIPILLSGVSAIAVHISVKQVTKLSEATKVEQLTIKTMSEMVYGISRMARNVRGQALFPQDPSYWKRSNYRWIDLKKARNFAQ